jgi:hypothetical protein
MAKSGKFPAFPAIFGHFVPLKAGWRACGNGQETRACGDHQDFRQNIPFGPGRAAEQARQQKRYCS